MKLYTSKSVDDFIESYVESGGEVAVIDEGCLAHGLTILYDAADRLYNYIITEVSLSCWGSADKVRRYAKLPKKYQKMIEEWENRTWEDEEV